MYAAGPAAGSPSLPATLSIRAVGGEEGPVEEIVAFDLKRMFVGDLPWSFTLEIAFRTAVMLVFTYGMVRIVGGRAVRQLSLVEFLLVVGLGSAVGDPMFYPDVPLLHGMVVVTVAVGLHRGLGQALSRSDRLEQFIEGVPHRVVLNGHFDHEGMGEAGLANDELFADLRQSGIGQLGEVRVAYAEANGDLSIFRYEPSEVRPGLSIEPPPELLPLPEEDEARRAGLYACRHCGRTRDLPEGAGAIHCECGESRWVPAVLPRSAALGGPREE